MNIRWSHCVLKARDVDALADFYCEAFGWQVADRGDVGENSIVFLTGSSSDHHQLAIMSGRPEGDGGSLDHNAFRVDSVDDVRDMFERMSARDDVRYAAPITHGNAVSVYFADPEGNGIEIFCDTPWHVPQPIVGRWDPERTTSEVLAGVESEFAGRDGAMAMDLYRADRANTFGEV